MPPKVDLPTRTITPKDTTHMEANCWYYQGSVTSELECPLCMEPLLDPVLVQPCEHMFCYRCLSKAVSSNTGTSCAVCRSDIESVVIAHRSIKAILDNTTVFCTRCGWQGPRERYLSHSNAAKKCTFKKLPEIISQRTKQLMAEDNVKDANTLLDLAERRGDSKVKCVVDMERARTLLGQKEFLEAATMLKPLRDQLEGGLLDECRALYALAFRRCCGPEEAEEASTALELAMKSKASLGSDLTAQLQEAVDSAKEELPNCGAPRPKKKPRHVDPSSAERFNDKARDAFMAKDYNLATKLYTKCIEMQPAVAKYYGNRAQTRIMQVRFAKALPDAEKAVELEPENVKFQYRLARCLVAVGEFEEAMKKMDEVLEKAGLERDVKQNFVDLRNECELKRFENVGDGDVAGGATITTGDNLPSVVRGGNWYDDMPRDRAYAFFVDIFRLHLDDNYTWAGKLEGIYCGEDSLPVFKRFLKKAQKRTGIMPTWFEEEKLMEEAKPLLKYAVEKSDIIELYSAFTPMAMRFVAEQITRRNVYGQHVGEYDSDKDEDSSDGSGWDDDHYEDDEDDEEEGLDDSESEDEDDGGWGAEALWKDAMEKNPLLAVQIKHLHANIPLTHLANQPTSEMESTLRDRHTRTLKMMADQMVIGHWELIRQEIPTVQQRERVVEYLLGLYLPRAAKVPMPRFHDQMKSRFHDLASAKDFTWINKIHKIYKAALQWLKKYGGEFKWEKERDDPDLEHNFPGQCVMFLAMALPDTQYSTEFLSKYKNPAEPFVVLVMNMTVIHKNLARNYPNFTELLNGEEWSNKLLTTVVPEELREKVNKSIEAF